MGALRLGVRQSDVRRLLGDPSSENSEELGGSISHEWQYDALGLSLSFDQDDDFGDSGRDFSWDDVNLTCWIRYEDSVVDSVSIMPLYNDTGMTPLWPNEVG